MWKMEKFSVTRKKNVWENPSRVYWKKVDIDCASIKLKRRGMLCKKSCNKWKLKKAVITKIFKTGIF